MWLNEKHQIYDVIFSHNLYTIYKQGYAHFGLEFRQFLGGDSLSELILTQLMIWQLINYTFINKCSGEGQVNQLVSGEIP